MKQYKVTGMSCAACAARIEKAVSSVPDVTGCAVSLLTNSMGVDGSASDDAVIGAVVAAGYGASPAGSAASAATASPEFDPLADREYPVLLRRFLISLGFLLVLMYVSMGHNMLGLPLPERLECNPVAIGLCQFLLSASVMLINKKFFISGITSLLHGAPNMDTLVSLGSSASFVWSVYALFMRTDAQISGGISAASEWLEEFYFESAAMILVLITLGKLLEARSKGKTTDALRSLMKLSPRTASVIRDDNGKETEVTIPADEVKVGDIFVVRPGENVPVDAVIIDGEAALDESALTGESVPADKSAGDTVYTASVNRSGYIRCRATRVGEDTSLSQIIKMVSDAAATKAPISKIADKVSAIFVPAVTLIAVVTLAVWLFIGRPFDYALARAISVLVISCPCALGLATPVAIMVGSGVGARNGVLFKTALSLEETGKTEIAIFDKTGTVTSGKPDVTGIFPASDVTEEELLRAAFSIEVRSAHPLAEAVVREAEHRGFSPLDVTDFRAVHGSGLIARLNGEDLVGGSVKFVLPLLRSGIDPTADAEALADRGATPLLFSLGGRYLGMIAVSDTVKPESAGAIRELEDMGITTVMLTGDNYRTARAVGKQAGIVSVIAGVMPDGKEEVVRRLKTAGKVAMIGDGINDAPALTCADTGIAVGAGTDVAIDAADVVLMKSRLTDVAGAIRLSRSVLTNVKENLFWAFFYNALCIPLAAGCFTGVFGWALNPMIAAAAMSLSSFCVVSNALRLNLFRFGSYGKHLKTKAADAEKTEKIKKIIDEINSLSEVKEMKMTLNIEGMMCPHCEAHVKKALEAVAGVETAVTSFKDGTAVLTLSAAPDEKALRAAVEDAGYVFLGIA